VKGVLRRDYLKGEEVLRREKAKDHREEEGRRFHKEEEVGFPVVYHLNPVPSGQ